MNKSEEIILEEVVKKLGKNLKVSDIHIYKDHWYLTIESLLHNKKFNIRLFINESISFNKFGYTSIRVRNKYLLESLNKDNPVFLFSLDITKKKIYYTDLQYQARVYFPINKEGVSLLKLYSIYDLDKDATLLIADHIIEYNYSWKSLYSLYRTYLTQIARIKALTHSENKTIKDFHEYYTQSIFVYKTLNIVNSKSEMDVALIKGSESIENLIKIINKNIDGIKGLIKDEKKYWLNNDPDFFIFLRSIRKIAL